MPDTFANQLRLLTEVRKRFRGPANRLFDADAAKKNRRKPQRLGLDRGKERRAPLAGGLHVFRGAIGVVAGLLETVGNLRLTFLKSCGIELYENNKFVDDRRHNQSSFMLATRSLCRSTAIISKNM